MKRFFLLAPLIASYPVQAQQSELNWSELVARLAAALSAGDARSFLGYFDRNMEGYGQLESYIHTLVETYEVSSSVELVYSERVEDGWQLRVDWLLELVTRQSGGQVERREGVVRLLVKGEEGKWQIVQLRPIDFFSPPPP